MKNEGNWGKGRLVSYEEEKRMRSREGEKGRYQGRVDIKMKEGGAAGSRQGRRTSGATPPGSR